MLVGIPLGAGGLIGALTVTTVNRLLSRRWSMPPPHRHRGHDRLPVLSAHPWKVTGSAFTGEMGGVLWTVNSRTLSGRLAGSGSQPLQRRCATHQCRCAPGSWSAGRVVRRADGLCLPSPWPSSRSPPRSLRNLTPPAPAEVALTVSHHWQPK